MVRISDLTQTSRDAARSGSKADAIAIIRLSWRELAERNFVQSSSLDVNDIKEHSLIREPIAVVSNRKSIRWNRHR